MKRVLVLGLVLLFVVLTGCTDTEAAIQEAYDNGYAAGQESGYAEGYESGYADAVNETMDMKADYYAEGKDAGYTSGYSDGETAGTESGYALGYEAGTTDGHTAGYDEGYTAGSADGYATGYSEGETAGQQAGYTYGYELGKDNIVTGSDTIVYITRSGTRYHTESCSILGDSKIPIALSDAEAEGYTACSKCH